MHVQKKPENLLKQTIDSDREAQHLLKRHVQALNADREALHRVNQTLVVENESMTVLTSRMKDYSE